MAEKIKEKIDPPNDSPHESTNEVDEYPYTVFSTSEKYMIAGVCGILGFWSAISGNIYYPIIFIMEKQFHVTEEMANVSVVMFFILQATAPMVTASIADQMGRKPVVLWCCFIYVVACVCLAVSNKYGLILFLRCVQAAGIAPVVAVNSGVCADLATRANRGSLLGFTSSIQLFAQAIGSLIGGLLTSGFGSWRAVFWFLAIGCGATAVLSFFLLPETNRTIVGNASIVPAKFINRSPLWLIPHFKRKQTNDMPTLAEKRHATLAQKLLDVPVIVHHKEIWPMLITAGLHFTCWTMMCASLSTTLQSKYGYPVRKVGLCFIAPGVASSIGSVVSGRLLDYFYKIGARKHKEKIAELDQAEPPEMDIFKVRIPMLFPCGWVFLAGLLVFGWCLDKHTSLAGILIGAVLTSCVNSPFVSVSTNLLADLYPTKTSTSTACVNLVRCLMAGCGIAALSRMQSSLTIGGCFTLLSGLCMVSQILIYVVMKRGNCWRNDRHAKHNIQ